MVRGLQGLLLVVFGVLGEACIGDVDVPPPAPKLLPVTSPTGIPFQVLSGSKERNTAIVSAGAVVVPQDAEESWSFKLALVPGENPVALRAKNAAGKESRDAATALIVYEPPCPAPPLLTVVTTPTHLATQTLSGSKPAATRVELWALDAGGAVTTKTEVAALDDATTWSYTLAIGGADGTYRFALVAVDLQGKTSEPVSFAVVLDTAAPNVVSRYPGDAESGVPRDARIEVTLDGALDLDPTVLPAGIVAVYDVSNSQAVAASVTYQPLSNTLTVVPVALAAQADIRVTLAAATFADRAGNAMAANVVWVFTTGASAGAAAPAVPSVTGGDATPTVAKQAVLSGAKGAWTSVVINGLQVVPLSAATTFTAAFALGVGENALAVASQNVVGTVSAATNVSIVRERPQPAPPTLDPVPPATVSESSLGLSGGKPADTAILMDGAVVICRTPETVWGFAAPLVPGPNELRLTSRDADGIESEPAVVRVDYAQAYSGQVPSGYQLYVGFSLRDLSSVVPISTQFETGANKYSVDVWIEGPLDAGTACAFDGGSYERQGTKLVATIEHYQGTKQGHTNPFADADYRAPDYVAALIAFGALANVGISATADRRSAGGQTPSALVTQLSDAAVAAIDETCSGRSTIAIDGCTEATVQNGLHEIRWLPLTTDSRRLSQGEYLLQIVINLDRDPGWVAANDQETCWQSDLFAKVGPHRIVRRLSLGATPYSLRIGRDAELSGPDSEPAATDGQLRFLAGDVALVWGPP